MEPGPSSGKTSQGRQRGAKSEKDRPKLLLSHHRMHRSSVRPFFCCGSQVSLNSITEIKDIHLLKDKLVDDDYEDMTDSDDLGEDIASLQIDTTLTLKNVPKMEKSLQRPARVSGSKRKKTVFQEKPGGRKKFWTLKLRGKLQVSKGAHYASESELSSKKQEDKLCVCTSYKSKEKEQSGDCEGAVGGQDAKSVENVSFPVSVIAHIVPDKSAGPSSRDLASGKGSRSNGSGRRAASRMEAPLPFVNLNKLYPINDIDEQLIAQRRREMEIGIDVTDPSEEDIWIHKSEQNAEDGAMSDSSASSLAHPGMGNSVGQYPQYGAMGLLYPHADVPSSSFRSSCEMSGLTGSNLSLNSPWLPNLIRPPQGVHTQVDYKHYLVPNMNDIVNSSFYWGVMDRYQAEKLIEKKPEGTFLLRDSAQDDFLFSVSFRRYGRSLHARIEQWNHRFSFDSRDPGVFATDSVCGLIEHYKDPSSCMFFEPMLTLPLHRNFPFSLQHLARATICSRTTYDGICDLTLPRSLKEYLRCYHYKQKVRVRRFDNTA